MDQILYTLVPGELWSWPIHMQRSRSSQSVQKYRVETDGQTDWQTDGGDCVTPRAI